MKIGILGGTFDPVHRGHLELAEKARAHFLLDKVIMVPAYQPPHKPQSPSLNSSRDRYEMVRLALEGETGLELSDCELRREGISYTIDTVIEFEKKYPGAEFFMILGGDSFEGLDAWHRAGEIKKKVRFLVARRGDCAILVPKEARVDWIRMPLCPVSASGIREALKRGESVGDAVSPKVLQYIRKHSLYGKSER